MQYLIEEDSDETKETLDARDDAILGASLLEDVVAVASIIRELAYRWAIPVDQAEYRVRQQLKEGWVG
jgi:hypothetical protein